MARDKSSFGSQLPQLGDAPLELKFRDNMQAIAGGIDRIFNGTARGADRKTGFVLLVFPFGGEPGARCNFVSNGADRQELVVLFKEMIARFEGQPETKGHA